MPLTITNPLPNTQVGPGTVAAAQTTTLPIPIDDYFVFRVTPQANELETWMFSCKVSQGNGIVSVIMGTPSDCQVVAPGITSTGQQGVAARLLVQQFHANGVLVDSVSQAMTWDGAGALWLYGDLRGWGTTSAQDGFTSADRALLAHADDGIWQRFPHA